MRIRWSGKLRAPASRQTGTGGYLWRAAGLDLGTADLRVTQLPRESVEVGPTLVRVTQAPTEAVEFATPVVQLRVTQLPAEAVEFATPVVRLRVTQLPIEVVYPFRCGDTPPVPGFVAPHTEKIRRLRRAPVLTQQALWQFFEWLELDLETGRLPDGVTEAIIQLRYSDDGGHTWSLPVPIDVGPSAAYAKRALWRRLGRGRDRVFEISMVDPILWAICAARLGVSEGTA